MDRKILFNIAGPWPNISKEPMKLGSLLIVLSLASGGVSNPAVAQYASLSSDRAAKIETEQKEIDAAHEKAIGARFWVVPNPEAITRLKFQEEPGEHYQIERFVLTETASFTVLGFEGDYVRVKFSDGRVAFLRKSGSFDYHRVNNKLFDSILAEREKAYDYNEYILTVSPEARKLADQKTRSKAVAKAAAWKARGGVRLGMTAQQARASNWGAPDKINRSSGSYGVHEQWVYGGNNYLYFENGVLSSIQN